MKIAVIYTGEVRTMEETIKYFKQNILLNDNINVFAILQTDNIPYYENIVKSEFQNHLKSLYWFDKDNETWINIRENLLNMIYIDESWINYLRDSGSMIEYYQMYLAYKEIENYEKKENIKYDYIMRIRCDVVLASPIYFDFDFSFNSVKDYLYQIKNKKKLDTIISHDILNIFMNTFYHKDRLNCNEFINMESYSFSESYNNILNINEDKFIKNVCEYLINGQYFVVMRTNQVYFIKRKYFSLISELGITYGCRCMEDNDYWLNAESQLKQICIENKIDFFDSTTNLEGKSLYEYNKLNYFENEELKITSDFLFFVMRN